MTRCPPGRLRSKRLASPGISQSRLRSKIQVSYRVDSRGRSRSFLSRIALLKPQDQDVSSFQKFNVFPVALVVARQFGESQIVRIRNEKMNILEAPWKHFGQAFFVALRHGLDARMLHMHFVLFREG